jgi:hypothetical protein
MGSGAHLAVPVEARGAGQIEIGRAVCDRLETRVAGVTRVVDAVVALVAGARTNGALLRRAVRHLNGRAVLALKAARQVATIRLRRCAAVDAIRALIDVDIALLPPPRVLTGLPVNLTRGQRRHETRRLAAATRWVKHDVREKPKTDRADAAPGAVAARDAGSVHAWRARAAVDRLLAVRSNKAARAAARIGLVGHVGAVAAVLTRPGGAAVTAAAGGGGAGGDVTERGAAAACAHAITAKYM